jgi:hypothetical protein
MSATIYAAPEEIKQPEIDFSDIAKYRREEGEYLEELKNYCQKNGSGKYAGEIVRIPHADGYASYMVISLKPLKLIHIPLGDAYDSQFADLLTVQKVKQMVDGTKRLAKLLSPHK